jgi:SAM-dependent methyltransferase
MITRTVRDFGEQWRHYTDNSGYYGSVALLADIFGPLLPLEAVAEKNVLDIGSGTGRIVNMLLDAGAAHVTAVEPSEAFATLVHNTSKRSDRVSLINGTGEDIPGERTFDLIVSVGVLHHVERPEAIVRRAVRALKPGGRMLVWLYGREGNRPYLTVVRPLRAITTRLPHFGLASLSYVIDALAMAYGTLSRVLPLPLHQYFRQVYLRLTADKRRLVIYDQLNPAYAKYYSREEARALLADNGLVNVTIYNRHGYSWTVCGDCSVVG